MLAVVSWLQVDTWAFTTLVLRAPIAKVTGVLGGSVNCRLSVIDFPQSYSYNQRYRTTNIVWYRGKGTIPE